jgi:PAS domain S-box-containing protein
VREHAAWLKAQGEALTAAVNHASLDTSLGALVRTATEALGEGVRAAFYLANGEDAVLHHVVGMSAEYAEAVDGFQIGPESLACGLAAYSGQPVLTADVRTDPHWERWQWLAERFDYRGCWSFPIHSAAGRLVGTLAMYFRQPREATARDLELASLLTNTASIIIAQHRESEVRKQAEGALRESEERLRVALAAGAMGTWQYRVSQDEQLLDDSMRRLAGLPPEAVSMPLDTFLHVIHEDDHDRVRAEFERCLREGSEIDTEFRVRWPDGSVHWLKDRGKAIPGPAGRPLFLTGAAVDITDRKRMEEELREADRAKNEFLAMLGHELRNPLAPLRGAN